MYRPAVNANVGERYAVLIILIPNVIPEIVGSLQNVINANMLHIIAIYIPITGINIDMPKILMQLLIMLSFLRIPY
ncbi:hypothetical protein ACFX2U_03440 [Gilliamella apicola]|uniref:hypothetical protein n=1 Tax=Gilliamella apicola TaxID=1196095 RepID=UPI003987B8C0